MTRLHLSSGRASLLRLAVLLLCLGAPQSRAQQPYEFIAIYEPLSASSGLKPISLPITQGKLVADGGLSHRLDRIVARFAADADSRRALRAFNKMKFTVKLHDKVAAEPVVLIEDIISQPSNEVTLLSWRGDGQSTAVIPFEISVQSIYSSQHLCLQELLLFERRRQDPKTRNLVAEQDIPRSISLNPTKYDDKDKDEEKKKRRRMVMKRDVTGPWLLYSFCELLPEQKVDYKSLVSKPTTMTAEETKALADAGGYLFRNSKTDSDDKLLASAHKQMLSEMIVEQLNAYFSSFAKVDIDPEEPNYQNVLINARTQHTFKLIKRFATHLYLEEAGGTVTLPANPNDSAANKLELIDQESKLVISLNDGVCSQLSDDTLLMAAPWKLQLEVPDAADPTKTKKVDVELNHRQPCSHVLKVNWKDYLDKDVTLRVLYHAHGEQDILMFQETFHVYNLGLITTFPVISEITSALQRDSPRDIEARSSIPVSWALPVRENRKASAAVTFPFTISFNTRQAPNLAEFVSLAPSISLIAGGPEDEGGERSGDVLRVGVGLGVNLARAFHFGYAWTPEDGGRYVLLGVSAQELFPLLKNL